MYTINQQTLFLLVTAQEVTPLYACLGYPSLSELNGCALI